MKKQVTDRIKKIRLERGISQENVADEIRITHSAYAKIERGETDPNVSRLFDLAKVFNVPVTAFFQDEDPFQVGEPGKGYENKPENPEELRQLMLRVLLELEKVRSELARLKMNQ